MKISIIHPSRNRPAQMLTTRLKWMTRADGKWRTGDGVIKGGDNEDWELEYIFSLDNDDATIPAGVKGLRRANKTAIEAINRAAEAAEGDLLIVVSDDFDCPPHWDTLLLEELRGKSDFLVKTRDGLQKTLITLPILDRLYYNRFGYVYHPEYFHMACDVELTAVGMMLGRVIQSGLLFEHLHYSTGKSPKDAINEKNDLTYSHGDMILAKHRENNFGIIDPVMKYEEIVW